MIEMPFIVTIGPNGTMAERTFWHLLSASAAASGANESALVASLENLLTEAQGPTRAGPVRCAVVPPRGTPVREPLRQMV